MVLISTVLVKIGTNNGTRGCSNPTKTSPRSPKYTCSSFIHLLLFRSRNYPSRQWFPTSLKSTMDTVVRLSPNMSNRLRYYYALPLYIFLKDSVNVYVNFAMSGKLWPLVHGTFLQFF
jgi:hypothetical protein